MMDLKSMEDRMYGRKRPLSIQMEGWQAASENGWGSNAKEIPLGWMEEQETQWVKITLEIPAALNDLLDKLARQEGISKARLVSFTCIQGLHRIKNQGIRYQEYKQPPNSPRVRYCLHLPVLPDQTQAEWSASGWGIPNPGIEDGIETGIGKQGDT
jgi:hypothetical protein